MTPFQTRYYDFWTKWVRANKFLQPFDVDFKSPFWHYLDKTRLHIGMISIHLALTYLFNPLFLIFITKAILEHDIQFFILLSAIKVIQQVLVLPFGRSYVYLYDIVPCSIQSTTQKFLIQVDPVYFTTKSSGEILAKIERTIGACHTYMSTIFETLLPFLISTGVALWVIAQIDWKLSLFVGLIFGLLCFLNIKIIIFNNKVFLPKINELEEKEKQFLLENIQQNQYIRSTFATPEQLKETLETIKQVSFDTATKWRTWQYLIIVLETFLIGLILLIVGLQITIPSSELYLIVAVFTSLYNLYVKYSEIGLVADDFFKSIHNQQEFWQFMRTFGKQSFPVIEETKNIDKTKLI
jgi:ABC-type multidrug transport system fused ATPase/permease subunit